MGESVVVVVWTCSVLLLCCFCGRMPLSGSGAETRRQVIAFELNLSHKGRLKRPFAMHSIFLHFAAAKVSVRAVGSDSRKDLHDAATYVSPADRTCQCFSHERPRPDRYARRSRFFHTHPRASTNVVPDAGSFELHDK